MTIHAIPSQNMIDQNIFPGAVDLDKAQPMIASTIPSINSPIYGITISGPPDVVITCCSDCSSIYSVQSTIFHKVY